MYKVAFVVPENAEYMYSFEGVFEEYESITSRPGNGSHGKWAL